jgi:hypothetical protein
MAAPPPETIERLRWQDRIEAVKARKRVAANSDMLQRLSTQHRIQKLDHRMQELQDMIAGTSRARLKEILAKQLAVLNEQRGHIA